VTRLKGEDGVKRTGTSKEILQASWDTDEVSAVVGVLESDWQA
jgi:hypothetical protein